MHLNPLFKMLLVGVFALACLLEGSDAYAGLPGGLARRGAKKIKQVQKVIVESFSGAAGENAGFVSVSNSGPAATLSSNPLTIKIEVKTKTEIEISCSTTQPTATPTSIFTSAGSSTPDETRVLAAQAAHLSAKTTKLLTLPKAFATRHAAHHASLQKKLTSINSTLTSISLAMAGADADVKFLQQLFFSQAKKTTATNGKTKIRVDFKKENIEKMVSYLRVRAGDNQQINFSAIVHSVKGVVKTIREMEQQLEKWDEYVATFEGEVQDVMKGVGELDLGGEVGSMEVVEVVETVQVVEEVRVGEEEPVGSVAGAFVRFKSWLDNQKTHEKAEAEEADGEQVENELRS